MIMLARLKSAWQELVGPISNKVMRRDPHAYSYNNVFTVSYTGEKNLGEAGPVIDYKPNFDILRFRSWQAYLESEIAQTILKKYTTWIIGAGLKLQAEPDKVVLASEKVKLDTQEFSEITEARFRVYSKSTMSDIADMRNLHRIAKKAHTNAIVGGDVLVILRVVDNCVKVQLIDGAHVCSPLLGNDFYNAAKEKGNRIKDGVELSPTNQHIAYYVKTAPYQFERIGARESSTNLTVAYLVYGLEYRLDTVRGIPLISTVIETIKKLERYKEATVGSAEERQKIPYFIEHGIGSTGDNPLAKNLAKAFNVDANINDLPIDVQGNQMANQVAVTTNKQVFNLGQDSTIKSLDSRNELSFKDFYTVNQGAVCSALQMPPDVATSKYDSNFSASRLH